VPLIPGTFAGSGRLLGVNLRRGAGLTFGARRTGARRTGARRGCAAANGIMPAERPAPALNNTSPFGKVIGVAGLGAGAGATGATTVTSSSTVGSGVASGIDSGVASGDDMN